ncbi:hypothetical protein [Pseudothermotoga thermarum]|nr:hypothetical protein [Pseudothermotoga thermarum]
MTIQELLEKGYLSSSSPERLNEDYDMLVQISSEITINVWYKGKY